MSRNMLLECDVVISKKLESVCEGGEPISIQINSISGNKGRAIIRMTCKNEVSEQDMVKIGETSLMLKIDHASDDIPSLGSQARISNLIGGGLPTSVESAVAITSPDIEAGKAYAGPAPVQPQAAGLSPDDLKQILAALAAQNLVPSAPQKLVAQASPSPVVPKIQPRDDCIMSYDELIRELVSIPGVDEAPKCPTDRKLQRQEAEKLVSQMPRLRRKAFIRNNLQSQLLIGDLFTSFDGTGPCLAMLPGAAFDLTRMPARNILNSSDLKYCFESGKVEMVNSATYAASFKKIQEDADKWRNSSELKVYGGGGRLNPTDSFENVAESIAAGAAMMDDDSILIGDRTSDVTPMEVGGNDRPAGVFEDEQQLQTIFSGLPTTREKPGMPPQRI